MREALDLAFDFEWTNKNLFFGLYTRTESYFENSDMKASGKPSADELALLGPFTDKLPPEVFGEPYTPPVTDGSAATTAITCRRRRDLLDAAGWTPGTDRHAAQRQGRDARHRVPESRPTFERIIVPYIENLKRIGVDASIRRVDPAQYERRVKSFDFDVTTQRYVTAPDAGRRAAEATGASEAAEIDGSFNLAGISDPVVDALIDKVDGSANRAPSW